MFWHKELWQFFKGQIMIQSKQYNQMNLFGYQWKAFSWTKDGKITKANF